MDATHKKGTEMDATHIRSNDSKLIEAARDALNALDAYTALGHDFTDRSGANSRDDLRAALVAHDREAR